MNLYIWNHPYSVGYGGSIVYAVAESETKARALAEAAPVSKYGIQYGNKTCKGIRLGKPDRVLTCPCAEAYEWSE